MTDGDFMRVLTIGVAVGFVLGIVTAGYAAMGLREKRPDLFSAQRRKEAAEAVRPIRGPRRGKGSLR